MKNSIERDWVEKNIVGKRMLLAFDIFIIALPFVVLTAIIWFALSLPQI